MKNKNQIAKILATDTDENTADAIKEFFAAPENPMIEEYTGSLIVG